MNGELICPLYWRLPSCCLVTGKVRMDAVVLFVIVAFNLKVPLTLPEAFGFSDPNVNFIAALFIIGDLASCAPALLRSVPLVKMAAAVKSKCWFY